MKCVHASKWMSLYVDGRLDLGRLGRLEQHLTICPHCRRDLARLRLMQVSLHEEPLVEEPAGLTEHVMRRISAYEAQRASDAAKARQRAAARAAERQAQHAQGWRAIGVRRALALVTALVALIAWAQVSHPAALVGFAGRLGPNLLQLLVTPGPYQVAWSVWIGGIALALGIFTWFARNDATEEWRRALAERLPQLW